MKKTLVALAVLAAAGSVNAAEVYNADGIVTSVSGVAEVQYYQAAEESADQQIRLDDFDLTLSTSVAVSDTLSAIGAVSLGGLDQSQNADVYAWTDADADGVVDAGETSTVPGSDNAAIDRVWVGFASTTAGTITFGRQTTILDDAGNAADFEFGGHTFDADEGSTSGSDVVKYVYDNGQFYLGASVDLKEGSSDDESASGRVGFRPTDAVDVVLYAYKDQTNSNAVSGATSENGYDLEVNFQFDENIALAGSYGKIKETDDTKTSYVQANASYSVDTLTYQIGFSTANPETGEDVSAVYANVIKQLATNVRVYAEVGQVDTDNGDDSNIGYAAGMEVKF